MPRSRTVPGLLEEMAARFPEREAVVGGRQRYTYRALLAAVREFAAGLARLGVCRGDKVAILMGNVPQWLVADFAVTGLGATLVSINTWVTRRELRYLLAHSDASVLITADRFLGVDYLEMLRALRAAGEWPERLEQVVCLGCAPDWCIPYATVAAPGGGVDAGAPARGRATVEPEDIAYLLYTSGSTSTPKGVPLQHFALIENMWHIGERQHLGEADRLWLGVSLYWGLGCENALFAIMTHGGCLVLQERFEAGEALRLIERERCTVYYGTPNMTRALLDHPDRAHRDLSSLRTGVTIGSPDQVRMAVELGASEICNVYGLTETYGNSNVTDGRARLEERLRCVGPALPGMEVVVAHPQSRQPLPAGEVGEIKIRGYVTPGYHRDEAKNAEAFDADGFFLTGDLGYLDRAGNLYFRGRLKEMVKTGGINVSPAEVEEVLASHAAVAQAYVVGLPDDQRDEIVAAVVVLNTGAQVEVDELREYCRERLSAYKVPRAIRFATDAELPLTSTRKLHKSRLAELFER